MRILILILLFPLILKSQTGNIAGQVTDARSGRPIPYATVFLNNSSVATQTDSEGKYLLKNIKEGHYILVVKFMGYETARKEVSVSQASTDIPVRLVAKALELEEVVVRPDPNQARNFALFRREFIGNTSTARQFKFINPGDVRVSYDEGKLLEASSDQFLVFENRHLGYRVKFLLNEFRRTFTPGTFTQGTTYYEGTSVFENLEGSGAQQKRWKKNRLDVYLGSSAHFYRSILKNTLQKEGFTMYQLIRKENTGRPADSVIERKLSEFRQAKGLAEHVKADSIEFWKKKQQLSRHIQYLLKDSLKRYDILRKTDQKGIFALSFPNELFVAYTGRRADPENSTVFKPLNVDLGEAETSIITRTEEFVLFDKNGIVINPRTTIYEGSWNTKITEMLPQDYEPGD